jgi:branched-chain amino acid transport system ATP-binding protein
MVTSNRKTLEAKNIHVSFGGIRALSGVDLALRTGDILGLIGPNGAGKTTMVNVLTGFQRTKPGAVILNGRDVSTLSAPNMARAGIGRSFQAARLFRNLSVLDNLVVAGLGTGLSKARATEQGREILGWMGLQDKADHLSSSLSYSSERRVSIARALALKPSFVLLDEPASGMNETECESLMEIIVGLPKQVQCGVLLIEHNMQVIMGVCDRIHVLDGGKSLAEGTPEEIKSNPVVLRAYLGDDASRKNTRI